MIEEVRKYRNATPFVPYTIQLRDGQQFHVSKRFHVALGGNRIVVYQESRKAFIPLDGRLVSLVSADALAA